MTQNSKVKNWSKLKLKTGPSMLRNIIGPVFNFRNYAFCCFWLIFQKISSFCRENEIFKIKNKKNKTNGPILTLKRAKIGPVFNFTACMYIYIYIYICMPVP